MDKLNIAELLKDCPSGTKLYSTVHGEVELVDIFHNLIRCKLFDGISFVGFHSDGRWLECVGECILFPSKDQRDWSKFHRPFKDGDIVCNIENVIIIYKKVNTKGYCGSFASLGRNNTFIPHYLAYLEDNCRFATEEEKQKLFDAIKANGYKWNVETKILEELIPNKFDITTLKPFDKVLVRLRDTDHWKPAFWGRRIKNHNFPFITSYGSSAQAIPFKNNEYLIGTTDDCDDYYKTW